jgi:hypothetical protein
LIDKDPAIELLDGLTVINHRLSIFKGFIECARKDEEGNFWLRAEMQGFTNTLRYRHRKPLVNLPGVKADYGEEIRGCLIAPEDQWLVGSDMVSLESTTRNHYIQPLDPAYVHEMDVPGFDPHMRLLVVANKITEEDYEFYVECKQDPENINDMARFQTLDNMRKGAKVVSYSAMYGVGAAKLARSSDMSEKEAKALLDAFWEMNWAIKKVAETSYVKELKDGSMWVKNPVSGFYYSLRNDRDRWSTINQSTGVYCFDTWCYHARKLGVGITASFHDEVVIATDDPDGVGEKLQKAIQQTNDKLQLNVPLGIDVQRGKNYADVH